MAVDGVRHARSGVFELVCVRPVGRLAVEELAEQGERPAAEPDAPAAVHVDGRPVSGIVARGVAPGVDVHVRRELPFLHDQVHDPRDGIGPVLRRGAVAQHLDPVEGALRHRVQVHAARARAHAVREVVHQRGLVLAPAVDQDERLVGGEATERKGAHDVAGVGDALVREVHRWSELLQDLAHLSCALSLDILGAEHVDRDGQLVRGCVAGTGSDRHVYGRKRDRLDHELVRGRLVYALVQHRQESPRRNTRRF